MVMARNPLTPDQRREIFARELALDFEALEALEDAVQHRSNADIRPEVYGGCLERDLETMAIVGQSWLTSGWPNPDHYDNCESYIAREFGGRLDELELVLLLGGLENSLEHVRKSVLHGAETALRAVGAEVNDRNRFAACKTVYAAKLQAFHAYREVILNPALVMSQAEKSGREQIPDTCAPYPVSPEWPHNLLIQIDHRGWPIDHRIDREPVASAEVETGSGRPVPANWANVTIVEAAERFILAHPKTGASEAGTDDKRISWNKDTLRQFRSTAMLAGKGCPGPIAQLRHDDLERLSNLFGRLPTNHHKSPRHEAMTLSEIADEAVALRDEGTLKCDLGLGVATINRHVRFLKELFEWVSEHVPLNDVRWSKLICKDRRSRRSLRREFEIEHGRALFQLPIWIGCHSARKRFKSGAEIYHDSCYWVILIIWYSGMRLTECCKLMLNEIVQVDGIWCMNIDVNENGGVKTEASKRKVPVHSELIRLGLLDFVTLLRRRGERNLFPELFEGSTGPAETWYTRFGQYFKKYLPFMEALMGAHSMRHSVETELRDIEVHEEIRNDLLGHINKGEGAGRYAKAPKLPILGNVIEKIPVVTGALRPHPIRLIRRAPLSALEKRGTRMQNQPRRTGSSGPSQSFPLRGSRAQTVETGSADSPRGST